MNNYKKSTPKARTNRTTPKARTNRSTPRAGTNRSNPKAQTNRNTPRASSPRSVDSSRVSTTRRVRPSASEEALSQIRRNRQ